MLDYFSRGRIDEARRLRVSFLEKYKAMEALVAKYATTEYMGTEIMKHLSRWKNLRFKDSKNEFPDHTVYDEKLGWDHLSAEGFPEDFVHGLCDI
jgi:hypothetical protein